MDEFEFNITGMTCASCSNTITRKLKRLDFVNSVDTDWKSGKTRMKVEINNEEIRKKVLQTISKLGYFATFA